MVYLTYRFLLIDAFVGLLSASGEDHLSGSETNCVLKNKNAILEEERALSEIGILGANKTKMFDSDSDLNRSVSPIY
jgi:hypothetical protein